MTRFAPGERYTLPNEQEVVVYIELVPVGEGARDRADREYMYRVDKDGSIYRVELPAGWVAHLRERHTVRSEGTACTVNDLKKVDSPPAD